MEGPFHRKYEDNMTNTDKRRKSKKKFPAFLFQISTKESGRTADTNLEDQNELDGTTTPSPDQNVDTLDLIIQEHIEKVNTFFTKKRFPIRLNYTAPSTY